MIGKVDVKTMDAHFYVQRSSDFAGVNTVIPFNVAKVNVGGHMDLPSGVFTAPVNGTYHFEFTGIKDLHTHELSVILQLNGRNIATAWTNSGNSASLSASLHLTARDKVRLHKNSKGILDDSTHHHTHFAGWLVEEDSVVAHH